MLISILTSILILDKTIQNDKILTCYYTNWAVYKNGNAKYDADLMYPYLCTHIIYSFANIDGQTLSPVPTDPWSDLPDGLDNFRKVTSLKNINPNLKVLLSVGGWQRLLQEFQLVSSNEENRKQFAINTKNYLKKYNFDGFDVDWEYPNDKEKFTLMMKALYEEFNKDSSEKYLLTMAVSAGVEAAKKSYDIPNLSKYVDYIYMMTYDFYGQFSRTVGHHSPLYCLNDQDQFCADFAVNYWLKNGASASKILIGVPTYGQGFKTNSINPHVGDVITGGTPMGKILYNNGILSYLEYCNEGYKNVWDEKQKAAHGVKDHYWLGYATKQSIHEKANYVKENELAGLFVWTLDFDDFTGNQCHNGKSPLIGAMHKELNIYPGIDWESQHNSKLSPKVSSTKSAWSPKNVDNNVSQDDLCSSVGFFPIDGCTKFLNCAQIGTKGYVQKCGSGLLFDVKTSTCNWKDLVDCSNSDSNINKNSEPLTTEKEKIILTTLPPTTPTTPTTEKSTTESNNNDVLDSEGKCNKVGFFALPGCRNFVICGYVGQQSYQIQCPGNLKFDEKFKYCNYPDLVDCKV